MKLKTGNKFHLVYNTLFSCNTFLKSCAISKSQYPTDTSLKYLIPDNIKEQPYVQTFHANPQISVSKVTFGLFLREMSVFAVKDKSSCLR